MMLRMLTLSESVLHESVERERIVPKELLK